MRDKNAGGDVVCKMVLVVGVEPDYAAKRD